MLPPRLLLAALLLAPMPAGAHSDPLPQLGDQNVFRASGSAQGWFMLSADAVVEIHRFESGRVEDFALRDDAHLQTTGRWAALVLQRVDGPEPAMISFVSLPGGCAWALAETDCNRYEFEDATGLEHAAMEADPESAPRYVLPAGMYVVAIMAEPEASTTASLALMDPNESGLATRAVGQMGSDLSPLLIEGEVLRDPTLGSLGVAVAHEPELTQAHTVLDAALPADGRLSMGMVMKWEGSSTVPHKVRDRRCLEWADLTRGVGCGQTDGFIGGCLCPIVGESGVLTDLGMYNGDYPPGTARWTWDVLEASAHRVQTVTWLIAWPYVAE